MSLSVKFLLVNNEIVSVSFHTVIFNDELRNSESDLYVKRKLAIDLSMTNLDLGHAFTHIIHVVVQTCMYAHHIIGLNRNTESDRGIDYRP